MNPVKASEVSSSRSLDGTHLSQCYQGYQSLGYTGLFRCHLNVYWLVLTVSMSNLNVPIGCQRGSRRDYAGKTLREVVKFPYENGDIAQVGVGRSHTVGFALPSPGYRDQIAPLEVTAGTQDNLHSPPPPSFLMLTPKSPGVSH